MPDEIETSETRPLKTGRSAEPVSAQEDTIHVLYHGPSDEFRCGDVVMTRHGPPVQLSKTALSELRAQCPEHAWSEIDRL